MQGYEQFVYPNYEHPLKSAFGARFECVYVMLHPFIEVSQQVEDSLGPYPAWETVRKARSMGERLSWRHFGRISGLSTYSEISHGMLTAIHALKHEYWNRKAAHAVKRALDLHPLVWLPDDGCFPGLLQHDILAAFHKNGLGQMVFVPELSAHRPQLVDLAETDSFPYRGTLLALDSSFLFVVAWDSYFTLFFGSREFVSQVVRDRQIEGFFATDKIRHTWWEDQILIPDLAPAH